MILRAVGLFLCFGSFFPKKTHLEVLGVSCLLQKLLEGLLMG